MNESGSGSGLASAVHPHDSDLFTKQSGNTNLLSLDTISVVGAGRLLLNPVRGEKEEQHDDHGSVNE